VADGPAYGLNDINDSTATAVNATRPANFKPSPIFASADFRGRCWLKSRYADQGCDCEHRFATFEAAEAEPANRSTPRLLFIENVRVRYWRSSSSKSRWSHKAPRCAARHNAP
jgi:hypothetical protein